MKGNCRYIYASSKMNAGCVGFRASVSHQSRSCFQSIQFKPCLFSTPRVHFSGVDESVLAELKNIWQSKLKASKVLESDVPPPTNDPMLAGPYIALQQQNNSTVSRHPGYVPQGHNIVDKQQQQQQDSRSPAVPVFRLECRRNFHVF